MNLTELTEREKYILRSIIQQFILTANPVGSRNISKKYEVGLSPASIRNIMSDLEDMGYLEHPHTSSGRVPTDQGYRFYVNDLMGIDTLDNEEKDLITTSLSNIKTDNDDIIKYTSTLLSKITNLISYVTYPKLENAVLEKIQLISIDNLRLLIVINIKQGPVKTITFELNEEINNDKLHYLQIFLNEKLSGLSFSNIIQTLDERIKDSIDLMHPVIRIFLDYPNKIFMNDNLNEKIVMSGVSNLFKHPEFEDQSMMQGIVEMLENKEVIVHILDKVQPENNEVLISIGSENPAKELTDYSLIIKEYKSYNMKGKIGVVGPKRIEYSKIVAIVNYISEVLNVVLKKN